MAIASINPATGEKLKDFPPHDDAEIEKRLKLAITAFEKHRARAVPQTRRPDDGCGITA